LVFAYHNHVFEFVQSDGAYLLDRLLDATDPALVALELDVYWAAYAGVDPAGYLRRRAGRVPLVHLKDLAADRSFAEVGDGTLDFAAIFATAEEGGVRWYIVEHDQPAMPALESARRSCRTCGQWGNEQVDAGRGAKGQGGSLARHSRRMRDGVLPTSAIAQLHVPKRFSIIRLGRPCGRQGRLDDQAAWPRR
jgi:hypothetical protein